MAVPIRVPGVGVQGRVQGGAGWGFPLKNEGKGEGGGEGGGGDRQWNRQVSAQDLSKLTFSNLLLINKKCPMQAPKPRNIKSLEKKVKSRIHSVHTRCIIKTRGFTRGVCKNRGFYSI